MTRSIAIASVLVGLAALVGLSVRAQTPPTPPAPLVDRVGFPDNYQRDFVPLFWFDRPDNGQIRVVYGNHQVTSVRTSITQGQPFPYGSIMVMETYSSQRDAAGNILRDANGHFIRNALTAIFVMRKERGFGVEYGENRNGEWEYVAYRPDRTYQTEPRGSWSCAQCHLQATQARDWVFRPGLIAEGGPATGIVPDVVLQQYALIPSTVRVRAGGVVTWLNDDEFAHRIGVTGDGGFEGPVMAEGGSFQARFNRPGQYAVACRIHTGMRSTVIVDP